MRPLTNEEMKTFFEKVQLYIGQNIEKLIDRLDEPHTFRLIKDRVYYLSNSQLKLATNIGRDNLISVGECFRFIVSLNWTCPVFACISLVITDNWRIAAVYDWFLKEIPIYVYTIGVCFGKFTQSGKFRLHVTCLDYLSQYSKNKVWVKTGAEMSFLYGNHVTKAGEIDSFNDSSWVVIVSSLSGLARITESVEQYAGVVVYSMSDIAIGFGLAAQPTEYCKDLDPTANVVLHQGDIGEYLRQEDGLF